MKTLQQYQSQSLPIDEFSMAGDEIDSELFLYIVGDNPFFFDKCIAQTEEAVHNRTGVYHFDTVCRIGKRFFYLGVLPGFQKPENKNEDY